MHVSFPHPGIKDTDTPGEALTTSCPVVESWKLLEPQGQVLGLTHQLGLEKPILGSFTLLIYCVHFGLMC